MTLVFTPSRNCCGETDRGVDPEGWCRSVRYIVDTRRTVRDKGLRPTSSTLTPRQNSTQLSSPGHTGTSGARVGDGPTPNTLKIPQHSYSEDINDHGSRRVECQEVLGVPGVVRPRSGPRVGEETLRPQ